MAPPKIQPTASSTLSTVTPGLAATPPTSPAATLSELVESRFGGPTATSGTAANSPLLGALEPPSGLDPTPSDHATIAHAEYQRALFEYEQYTHRPDATPSQTIRLRLELETARARLSNLNAPASSGGPTLAPTGGGDGGGLWSIVTRWLGINR